MQKEILTAAHPVTLTAVYEVHDAVITERISIFRSYFLKYRNKNKISRGPAEM
jgi:hypothetical protein